ncbi:MAG TPA: hypothetical protein EYP30_08755 [Archaeoglobaceae archaeon]|nr:hypothetical protein [Archaeoglobaceae archaeon]
MMLRDAFNDALLILLRKFTSLYFLLKSVRVVYLNKEKTFSYGRMKFKIVAETDGRTIYLYPEWLNLDERNRLIVLIHELLHIMLLHPFRKLEMIKGKKHRNLFGILANMAIDAKVDYYIKKLGIDVDLPDYFSKDEIERLSAEELFEKLVENHPENISPPDLLEPLSNFEGEVLNEGKKIIEANSLDELENELGKIVTESLIAAKTAGKLSGFEEWILNLLLESRLNWTVLLRRAVASSLAKSYVQTWSKLNRKSKHFPGYKRITRPHTWCFVDVSGSISYEEFKQFMSEVLKVSRDSEVILVLWDTEVRDERMIRGSKDLTGIKFKRGGGTTFFPIITRYMQRIRAHDVVVCLSDGVWYDADEASKVIKKVRASKILVYTSRTVPGFNVGIEI